ncbi:hypothetical protein [Methylomonas sp. MgM2]
MKVTQVRLYMIIGAISDVSIVHRTSSSAYEAHFFVHSDSSNKLSGRDPILRSIDGTARTWDSLGEVYSFVRGLGWKQIITVANVE